MEMQQFWIALGILVGSGLAALAAHYLAEAVKLGEMSGRIALTAFLVVLAVAVCWQGNWMPRLGVDLSGGVVMVYEIDRAKTKRTETVDGKKKELELEVTSKDLVGPISKRLNPGGIKELVIRPYGKERLEVIIPRVERDELERIKQIMGQAGYLEFRIMADRQVDSAVIAMALANSNPLEKIVRDQTGQPVAQWVKLGREDKDSWKGPNPPYRRNAVNDVIRDAATGKPVEITPDILAALAAVKNKKEEFQAQAFDEALKAHGIKDLEILVLTLPEEFHVVGKDILVASPGHAEDGLPQIEFTMTGEGAQRMGALTGKNVPNSNNGHSRLLTIILDENLISAANIQSVITERGRITGRFSMREVEDMVKVLQAGRLPAVLRDTPISEEQISPLLGQDTIDKGRLAVVISLAAVVIFMVGYYNFAGMVASFALILNLLFTIALMILFKARLTLPGMAGLVLTVGMSVDANVLIYERIRDELNSGAGLRMAIRNGFSRALSAIIDGNVTTILTAVVLYVIGTDTIRGFAVTTILGILTSMFTAIFVARLVFDIWEKKGWLPTLSFHQLFGKLNVDFFAIRWQAIGFSAVLIVTGLVVAFLRGENLLDVDLNGGNSVQILTNADMSADEIRAKVEPRFPTATVTAMNVAGLANRVYKIDTPLIRTTGEGAWKIVDVDHDPTREEVTAGILRKELVRGPTETSPLPSGAVVIETIFENDLFKGQLANRSLKFTFVSEKKAASPVPAPVAPTKPGPGVVPPPDPTPPSPAPKATTPEPKATTPEPKATPEAPEPKAATPEPKASPAPEDKAPAKSPDDKLSLRVARGDQTTAVLFQAEDAPAKAEPKTEPAAKADPPVEAKTPPDPAAEPQPPVEPKTVAEPKTGPETTPSVPPGPVVPGVEIGRLETTFDLQLGDLQLDPSVREKLSRVTKDVLVYELSRAARAALGLPSDLLGIRVVTPDGSEETAVRGSSNWKVTLPLAKEDAEKVMAAFERDYTSRAVFPSSSEIGGLVAGNTLNLAYAALVVSWMGMIAYLWFRFQKVMYGISAVIALVHDVLIAIFALAVSVYVAPFLGFLQIEDFKISLSVIAALLTIVGYSVNDTIVLFDRIREVRGKLPVLTVEMVNDSINATMSRTVLTSLTVFMVVCILYFLGGPSIHAFAFTMVVGTIAGTYSTIYIAAPLLLMFEEGENPGASKAPPAAEREKVPV